MKQLILGGLRAFGRILGVTGVQQSEALLHSEAGARSLLSRRGFMGASAALAATAITYSIARPSLVWRGKPGYLYMSLHTADPQAGALSEASYVGYSRVAIERSPAHWAINRGAVNNLHRIQFPAATGGSTTVTHLALLDDREQPLMSMELDHLLNISTGVSPRIEEGGLHIDARDLFEGKNIGPAPALVAHVPNPDLS